MTKHRRKIDQQEGDIMRLAKLAAVGLAALGTVAGTVWGASTFVQTLATRDELVVVQAQVQTTLDLQMESIIAQIARLEAKQPKTQDDRDQINYLRGQLDRLRKMRAIK